MGNIAKQGRLGLFQDSDFAGDLEDSKSTSGGTLCVFGSPTFVPKSWMCKKQTAVSHSSTDSEIISLDAGLRLDGLLALELWDFIVSVFGSVSQISDRTEQLVNDVHKHLWDLIVSVLGNTIQTHEGPGRPVISDKNQRSQGMTNVLNNIDSVPSNVQSSRQEALLSVCV